jgi:tricorn protease
LAQATSIKYKRDIWNYDVATDTYKMITSFEGGDRMPVFSSDQNSLYYLIEQRGTFNVHKSNLYGSNTSQLKSFNWHPLHFLSFGNGTICFRFDGKLYTMKKVQELKKLVVHITTQQISNSDKFISIIRGFCTLCRRIIYKENYQYSRRRAFCDLDTRC